MKSTKILLIGILISLSLAATGCVSNSNKTTQNNTPSTNATQDNSNSNNDDSSRDFSPFNTVSKFAPEGKAIENHPLSSEVTDSSFIPKNLLELSTEDLLKTFTDLGIKIGPGETNAKAGRFIKEYFEKSGLQPYKDGSFYNKFYASQEIDIVDNERNLTSPKLNGYVENIVGKIKGKDSSKAIVVSAHFDTFLNTKGVLDNASGTITLMKIGKILTEKLKGEQPPVDIILVAFNNEERLLLGSQYFYGELSADYKEFHNINIDCVGLKDKDLAYKNTHKESEELFKAFAPYLDKYRIARGEISYASLGESDHTTFQQKQKAAINLIDELPPSRIHTPNDDTLEGIDTSELEKLANAISDFIISDNGKIY